MFINPTLYRQRFLFRNDNNLVGRFAPFTKTGEFAKLCASVEESGQRISPSDEVSERFLSVVFDEIVTFIFDANSCNS
jgi:hypothetical protein